MGVRKERIEGWQRVGDAIGEGEEEGEGRGETAEALGSDGQEERREGGVRFGCCAALSLTKITHCQQ